MTTGDHALRLLDEANPVPDLDSYGAAALTATDYLSTIEQLTDEMIDIDRQPTAETKIRQRVWLTAAAILAVVVGVAVFANLGDPDIAEPVPPPLPNVTMEFQDVSVAAELTECPLDLLRAEEDKLDLQLEGTDQAGQKWNMNVVLNAREPGFPFGPGLFYFGVESSDGTVDYRGHTNAPLTTDIQEAFATYTAPMYDNLNFDPDESIWITVTIECESS